MRPMDWRELLEEVAEILNSKRVTARVYIVGGAAMAMAYDSERFTHDIDGVILDGHGPLIAAVHQVAQRRGLPMSWLNEQASAYMPRGGDPGGRVVFDHPSLRVTAASPERMLAMKAMSARPTDISDLKLLVDRLGYTTPEQVLDTTASLFPDQPLPERSIATVVALFAGR